MLQQRNTNQRERLAIKKPRGERIEIRMLQYKVQRTTAYAATTPTVTVFHSKPRRKSFMQTWLHRTHQHAQYVS